jgi:hypothetical protein
VISHPSVCVCDVCLKFRDRAAARIGKRSRTCGPRRCRSASAASPFSDNRKASAAAVLALKAEEEKRLIDALERAVAAGAEAHLDRFALKQAVLLE